MPITSLSPFTKSDFYTLSQHADTIFSKIVSLTDNFTPQISDIANTPHLLTVIPELEVDLDNLESSLDNAYSICRDKNFMPRLAEIREGVHAAARILFSVQKLHYQVDHQCTRPESSAKKSEIAIQKTTSVFETGNDQEIGSWALGSNIQMTLPSDLERNSFISGSADGLTVKSDFKVDELTLNGSNMGYISDLSDQE